MSKPTKSKGVKASGKSKKTNKKPMFSSKNRRILTAPITTAAVRFGSLGENAYIYTKEGVEAKFDKIKNALLTLATLGDLDELGDGCTMYDIRQRVSTISTALVNIANAM